MPGVVVDWFWLARRLMGFVWKPPFSLKRIAARGLARPTRPTLQAAMVGHTKARRLAKAETSYARLAPFPAWDCM